VGPGTHVSPAGRNTGLKFKRKIWSENKNLSILRTWSVVSVLGLGPVTRSGTEWKRS
jgi:hypothetical protein